MNGKQLAVINCLCCYQLLSFVEILPFHLVLLPLVAFAHGVASLDRVTFGDIIESFGVIVGTWIISLVHDWNIRLNHGGQVLIEEKVAGTEVGAACWRSLFELLCVLQLQPWYWDRPSTVRYRPNMPSALSSITFTLSCLVYCSAVQFC